MIAIIDYGMGNSGSIHNMLNRIGAESSITSCLDEIAAAEKLILPGVGAYDRAMELLEGLGMQAVLDKKVLEQKTPILGICLGMQLFTKGSEEGKRPGLGWVDAETVRFKFEEGSKLKLPHMGWNQLRIKKEPSILSDQPERSRFYFVHTYHVKCANEEDVLAEATYGYPFHAAFQHENIIGTQFHPEKSHKFGLQIMAKFAEV